jgi:hypothetical protein
MYAGKYSILDLVSVTRLWLFVSRVDTSGRPQQLQLWRVSKFSVVSGMRVSTINWKTE